jgi:uncharacterized protein (TIGR03435 family)
MFGQFDIPGLFGKITSRPKAGDLAPEISFAKVLHNAGTAPWSSAHLSGQVTVLQFLPYVSGNPRVVDEWNALVESFAGKPVQFAWIAGEEESTLLPFLREHPIKGWVFHDPDGKTGRAYGLESPEPVILGSDRRIVGFGEGFPPRKEVVNAALEDRIAMMPPKPTFEDFKAFSESGREVLSPEARRMPRPEDHQPDFSPSYTVHIAPAKDKLGGGNFHGMDYWSLQSYSVKRVLAEVLGVNPIRIDLPASIDAREQYDFSIVLPKYEDQATMRGLIRQGVEDYFHLAGMRERRMRDVYVLTAAGAKLRAASGDSPSGAFGFSDSFTIDITDFAGFLDRPNTIDAMGSISMGGATVDEFCHMLESNLDRPVVNETKLDGRFDFQVQGPVSDIPKRDFVERLREQLGLVIAPGQRTVEAMVYRLR